MGECKRIHFGCCCLLLVSHMWLWLDARCIIVSPAFSPPLVALPCRGVHCNAMLLGVQYILLTSAALCRSLCDIINSCMFMYHTQSCLVLVSGMLSVCAWCKIGQKDPGAPQRAAEGKTRTYKTKSETQDKKAIFSTIVLVLLGISVVVPMLQYWGYTSKEWGSLMHWSFSLMFWGVHSVSYAKLLETIIDIASELGCVTITYTLLLWAMTGSKDCIREYCQCVCICVQHILVVLSDLCCLSDYDPLNI